VLIKPPSGWLPADSSILISILKATDNNDFPFFSQPFSGMTDELTSFPNILLSAHSLSLYLNKDVIPSEFPSQRGPCWFSLPGSVLFFLSTGIRPIFKSNQIVK
jgi:hypothetical protein